MTRAEILHRWTLSENKVLRLFAFFILYVGQGLPLGVSTIAFPAWLVANGAPEADVAAVIATSYLPWSFKFIPAAFMDRYAYLAMGRRRAWLIMAQGLMIAGFAMAAIIAPGPEDIDIVLYIVFMIGAGSAIQDVAVDGLAVDILPEKDQGTASSFMFAGQATGSAGAGAASGIMLQFFGSQITFLAFLPVIILITLFVVLIRERPGEKRLPWTKGAASQENLDRHVGAWWPMAVAAFWSMIKIDSLKLMAASISGRTGAGIITAMWPIIGVSVVGYSTATYATMYSAAEVIAAMLAIGVGSFLTTYIGPRRATALVMVCYALLGLFLLYFPHVWGGMVAFAIVTGVWLLISLNATICSNPLRMQLSDPKVAATQFTLYNSISNLPISLGATIFALLGGTEEMTKVLWLMAGLMIVSALIYSWMKVGDKPVDAEPAAEFN